ncbi:cell division protein ZapA [Sphingomonas sp. 1P06PA]|uniref:cell division protein ZapA n=1 Tax=Sphingomonas sp. 1P06PA TaxID=554121 RepID=UPI0039A464E1
MAAVELKIGGRSYEIACRDGEEDHFRRIAAMVDARAADATRAVGGLTETRTLLFASLLLADELASAPTQPAAAPPAPAPSPADDDQAAQAIERLASRIEALAERLESGHATA